jgi:hypothetical protein
MIELLSSLPLLIQLVIAYDIAVIIALIVFSILIKLQEWKQ